MPALAEMLLAGFEVLCFGTKMRELVSKIDGGCVCSRISTWLEGLDATRAVVEGMLKERDQFLGTGF